MKVKIYNIILFSLLLLISINTYSQSTLENYLKIAAKNNPELKATFSEYMAAMEKIPQVGALPDPQVAFGNLKIQNQIFSLKLKQLFIIIILLKKPLKSPKKIWIFYRFSNGYL